MFSYTPKPYFSRVELDMAERLTQLYELCGSIWVLHTVKADSTNSEYRPQLPLVIYIIVLGNIKYCVLVINVTPYYAIRQIDLVQ